MFNAPPEADFAKDLYELKNGQSAFVSVGQDLNFNGNGERFRKKYSTKKKEEEKTEDTE